MATMVGLNRGTKTIATNELHEIEVVDGQQRLTTLILLYKALSMALDRDDKDECAFADEIETLLVKGDDVSLLLLQTNHDTSHYFITFLRDGTYPPPAEAKTLADRLLLQAMKDCSDFVVQWQGSKLELGIVLKNRLALIFHEVDDEATVYSVRASKRRRAGRRYTKARKDRVPLFERACYGEVTRPARPDQGAAG